MERKPCRSRLFFFKLRIEFHYYKLRELKFLIQFFFFFSDVKRTPCFVNFKNLSKSDPLKHYVTRGGMLEHILFKLSSDFKTYLSIITKYTKFYSIG